MSLAEQNKISAIGPADIPPRLSSLDASIDRDGLPGTRLRPVHYIVALVMAIVAAILTGDAWADMIGYGWKDEESSHVLLVPVALAWIAFVRRSSLVRCVQQGIWIGPLFSLLGLALWIYGWRRDTQSAWHFGAVLFAFGAALSVLGKGVLIRMWPAALCLLLLVPIPATGRLWIAQPLQLATATVAAEVGQVLGMDVIRQGCTLQVNGQNVTVAEACNGMRMVFTLLLVCYVFAFTTPLNNSVRLMILILSPVIAIIANLIRLVPTIWAYGHLGADVSNMLHDVGGWAMLFAAFAALMGSVKLLRWLSIPVSPKGIYAD